MRKTYYTGPRNGELKAALQLLFNNLSDNLCGHLCKALELKNI